MALSQRELEPLYDPLTYEAGVPLDLLASLRTEGPVIRVDEHALPQWPQGPGFWLVLRHAECMQVLKNTADFSSHLGGTQLRDPATPEDLAYVQQMMLNMDPPEHTRLRRLLINAFTSRAVAKLEQEIAEHARSILDRVIAGIVRAEQADRSRYRRRDDRQPRHDRLRHHVGATFHA